MENSATLKPAISPRKTLTELVAIKLRYTGRAPELVYEQQFTVEHGFSLGRLGILLQLLEHFGPKAAREADDATLERFFNQEMQDNLSQYGLNTGSILGLTGDSSAHGLKPGRVVLLQDSRGDRPRVSRHGLAAFRDIATHYAGADEQPLPPEVAMPDMVALRQELEYVRDQLFALELRSTTRGDGPAPIGHNNPPEELLLGAEPLEVLAVLGDIPVVIASTESDHAARSADPLLLVNVAGRLNSIARSMGRWLVVGGAQATKGVAQAMGKEAWENPTAFMHKLKALAHWLIHWAATLMS